MAAPLIDALAVAEDTILAALSALDPTGAAWWDLAPPDTARRLALPTTDALALSRAYVAQHQDGGGRRAPLVHSMGWEGLITCRVLSRSRAAAIAGHALASAALLALAGPAGYALSARWERPLSVPFADLITTRAGLWRITIRRVPV